ncbi:MAG: Crp/Fnr family transcriptional regulator [Bacteroidetes bacterium]|nr:Crp/Fnr family transcriptional regulator [Bacteroidota bacterium]
MENLSQLAAFKSSPELVEKLIQFGVQKSFSAGSVVLQEQAFIHSIPIVMKGVLKVTRTEEDGRELLLYYIQAGESCIMSFLGGLYKDTSKVCALVEEDAVILFLPVEKVSLFIHEHPEWLDYIFRLYHKRFEELLEVVHAIAFKKVDERLLLSLKKKASLTESQVLRVTHEQLANELGTARVVVSRLLKQLEENGVVKLGRNKITLV